MPSRARFRYVPDVLAFIIEEHGLTITAMAHATGITERHYYNILASETVAARAKTRKKIILGFCALGVPRDQIETLFHG